MNTKRLWKIFCEEEKHPGMWRRWFKNQCVAVGWSAKTGFHLIGRSRHESGWSRTRRALQRISPGDHIIVSLRGNKIGRIGEVTRVAVTDDLWDPLVPPSRDYPHGEKGRRIFVRWDLECAPDDSDLVVVLPKYVRLNSGELRPTICQVKSVTLRQVRKAMSNPVNWVSLLSKFSYEKSMSDYIATYPHRLEDGLLPHSNKKVRERIFTDRKRTDVLLEDRDGKPVIVECKQDPPTVEAVNQLKHYLKKFHREERVKARGILVHGGSRKLRNDVRRAARKSPRIELVQFKVEVEFSVSGE